LASSGAPPEAEAPPSAEAAPDTIRVVPDAEGGYEVHLPANGINITPRGDGERRVSVTEPARHGQGDLNRILSDAMKRALSDTERYAGTAVRHVQTIATKLVGGVFSFFIMLMISAYMLITSDRIFAFFRSLARPDQRERFDDLVARIDRGLAGVVRGQLLIAVVNGVLSGI